MTIKSTNSSLSRLALATGLCLFFGYFMGCAHSFLPSDSKAIPFFFMAVFLLPVTAMTTCISKIGDVNKIPSLSSSERRRLVPALRNMRNSMYKMIAFQCTLAIFSGVALFLASNPSLQSFSIWIYRGVGAAIAFAIAILMFSLVDLGKLNDFEALLINREAKRKNKKAVLKKMGESGASEA